MYDLRNSNEDSFLHEPPMSSLMDIPKETLDHLKLNELVNWFFDYHPIDKIDESNKSIIIDMINEEKHLSKQKEAIEKKYDQTKSILQHSMPEKKDLIVQNEEMDYVINELTKNANDESIVSKNLQQKKAETEKMLRMWVEICNNTPQLAECANLIDINSIENTTNSDLMNYFNRIIKQITLNLNH